LFNRYIISRFMFSTGSDSDSDLHCVGGSVVTFNPAVTCILAVVAVML
jgi:hypothetical protein